MFWLGADPGVSFYTLDEGDWWGRGNRWVRTGLGGIPYRVGEGVHLNLLGIRCLSGHGK